MFAATTHAITRTGTRHKVRHTVRIGAAARIVEHQLQRPKSLLWRLIADTYQTIELERPKPMTERLEIDHLMRALYFARVQGDLEAVCASFSSGAKIRFSGASQASPISVAAVGLTEFRPLLALMIKTFKLRNQTILSIIIDGSKAAVHWRAEVHSKITGSAVLTELLDLVEVRDGCIVSYTEFFVPADVSSITACQ